MDNQQILSPQGQAIFDEMKAYHFERLLDVESRLRRKRIGKEMDGEYSLTRLLNAQREDRVRAGAPYELACSDRIAEEIGRPPEPGYLYVPVTRDLTAGVAGSGGFLVSTAPGDVFSGYLHAASVGDKMGVERLTLQGNGLFPRITGTATAGWLSTEGSQLTESNITLAIAAATPKLLGAFVEVSDQLLKQTSSAAQNIVMQALAKATAAVADAAFISGTGATGTPFGLLSVPGIGSVTGTSIAWAGILDMLKSVEDANAIISAERAGWITTPSVARLLRAREKVAGNGGFIMEGNDIAGYRALATNSVPAATAVFGDWSQIVRLEWGVLQIGVDPYGVNSSQFQRNMVGLRTLWAMDNVVLQPSAFCKSESIT